MAAQIYPTQNYPKAPMQPPAGPSRRYPLTNAVSHNYNQQQVTPPKHHEKPIEKQAKPASPPLPRQNSKTAPPSPPKVISDYSGALQFNRVGFLGEGGFARVYEVKDQRGTRIACKVVTKASLKTKKAKTKLYAEIKIHRSLSHPNIVGFQECFEDDENVYMTLELCHSGSLMDMLRRRRRFTEPEARFFMVQLLGACNYMHTHQVIHRDLKLGNLFLDQNMNVKVGDFGLAALIESPGERKKTICGTPNYIAPEVLFDTANGHSFEVDTWSIGVILYTLAVGRPPFQTKEVKAIYKRIRDNDYEFPADRSVSLDAKQLVQAILTQDPQMRPTLYEIADHTFFTEGTFPPYVPTSAYDTAPDFRHVTRLASDHNYRRIRRLALLDEDQVTAIAVPKAPAQTTSSYSTAGSATSKATAAKSVTSSIAQQEKEFQKAVQPGSPISALLSSARQPLLISTTNTKGNNANRESPLFRKLQAASAQVKNQSPLGAGVARATAGRTTAKGLQNIVEEDGRDERWEHEQVVRRKELEAQKARIVAQMAPAREEDRESAGEHEKAYSKEKEHVMQKERDLLRERERQLEKERARARERVLEKETENMAPARTEVRRTKEPVPIKATRVVSGPVPVRTAPSIPASALAPISEPRVKVNAFDAAAHVLTLAFDAKAAGKLFRDPRHDARLPPPEEGVFIASWLDYCNKYGMAYALTDGSVGVHFNDSTTLVLSADKRHFDYITSRQHGAVYVRKSHTVELYPDELKSKVYLLKHFERYIMDRLWGQHDFTFEDVKRTKGMEWVQKYLRMKNVIVFKLSHDVLQFNFYDHSKLILSSHGLAITHIDKNYQLTRWTLNDIMAQALKGPSANMDPAEAKFHQRLVDKLKFCKEVLISIHTASASGNDLADAPTGMAAGDGAALAADMGLNTKMSKASLR